MAEAEIMIDVSEASDASVHLTSVGLSAVGKQELTIRHVPIARMRDAAAVINLVNEQLANRTVSDRERLGVDYPIGSLIVRFFKDDDDLLRICDGHHESPGFPDVAIASAAILRAEAAEVNGDPEGAVELLVNSISEFPGVPGLRDEPHFDIRYNWQNARTYFRLFEVTGGNLELRTTFLRSAVERSAELSLEVLGCELAELDSIDPDVIETRAHLIVEAHLEALERSTFESENAAKFGELVFSPIWRLGWRQLLILPRPLIKRYYQDVMVKFDLGELSRVVCGLWEAHAHDPVAIAAATWDSCDLFSSDTDANQEHAAGHPADLLLSAIFAQVLRVACATSISVAERALQLDHRHVVKALRLARSAEESAFRNALES